MDKKKKIRTLSEYIKEIESIKMDKDHTMELKKVMFRGQSNVGFKLTPSLGRRPSPTYANSLTTVEHQLIRFARQKFPIQFSETDHPVILLAKLQHYGVPTRMLDITENAFVALYFACNNNEDVDGAVFVFEIQRMIRLQMLLLIRTS